jgi:O-antigen/teichoic acid export membrane protein
MPDRRAAVRGVAWGGVESAAAAVVGLILTPLVVRAAGVDGLGLWGAAWALAHAAGTFDLGVGASYARFAARALARGDTGALNRTLAAGVGFYCLLVAAVGGAVWWAAPRILARLDAAPALAAVAPLVLGSAVATVGARALLSAYRGVLAGAQRFETLGRIGTAAALVEGVAAAAILAAGGGLGGLAVNSLLVALGVSAAEALCAHRAVPGLRVRPFQAGRRDYAEVLGFGARLQATRAAEILGEQVPRLALAWGSGLAAAGLYDLAARLAGVQRLAGRLPLPVLQPLASRLEALGRRDRLEAVLKHVTRYVALLALPAAALILLDAETLLCAWTGRPQAAAAAPAARLLAGAVGLALVLSPLRLILRGCGFPGVEAAAAAGGTLLHLALALLLAPRAGAAGVALAALIAAVAAGAVLLAGARRAGAPVTPAVLAGAVAGPAAAGLAVLASGWLVLAARAAPAAAGRAEAVARLLPEIGVALAAGLAVAFLVRAVRPDDLLLLRELRGAGGEARA